MTSSPMTQGSSKPALPPKPRKSRRPMFNDDDETLLRLGSKFTEKAAQVQLPRTAVTAIIFQKCTIIMSKCELSSGVKNAVEGDVG